MTMNKEFVTYDQALALKELGFYEHCMGFYYYAVPELRWMLQISSDYHKIVSIIDAPLKQQVFRWFREKYGWYANLSSWIHEPELGTYHEYEIYGNPNGVYGEGKYDTYEEAENACLDKLISICKQQENGMEINN